MLLVLVVVVLFFLHDLDGYYPGHVDCETEESDADRFPGIDER